MVLVFSAIAAALLLLCFCQLFYVKLNHPYQGSHYATEEFTPAPVDHHPEPENARYVALWKARMYGEADFLTVDIAKLDAVREANLARDLSNWNWAKVPTTEWPRVWINNVGSLAETNHS